MSHPLDTGTVRCQTCSHYIDEHSSTTCYGLDLGARPCPCLAFTYAPTATGCRVCDESGAPCVEHIDDDPDGLAAELVELLAAKLEPLTGPGFADGRRDPFAAGIWTSIVHLSRIDRARRVREGSWMPGDLAAEAAESGIVPRRGDLRAEGRRGVELVNVWSSWMTGADAARLYAYTTEHRPIGGDSDGTDTASEPSYRAWRGDLQADYDGSEERYNLSPAGPWYGNLPPIYAAGLTRTARWCPGHRPGESCADSAR